MYFAEDSIAAVYAKMLLVTEGGSHSDLFSTELKSCVMKILLIIITCKWDRRDDRIHRNQMFNGFLDFSLFFSLYTPVFLPGSGVTYTMLESFKTVFVTEVYVEAPGVRKGLTLTIENALK